MDDLVVIILTLVVVAFGLFGQMKKKRQSQPVKEGAQGAQAQPENIWEMIQREMNPVPPTPQVDVDENKIEVIEKPEHKTIYNFEPTIEGSSLIDEKIITETSARKYRKIAGDRFSLRKAVIYSEILNRKYL